MSDLNQAHDQIDMNLLRRLADSEKAHVALQRMVDALASLPALEHFVPAALRIVASAFDPAIARTLNIFVGSQSASNIGFAMARCLGGGKYEILA